MNDIYYAENKSYTVIELKKVWDRMRQGVIQAEDKEIAGLFYQIYDSARVSRYDEGYEHEE